MQIFTKKTVNYKMQNAKFSCNKVALHFLFFQEASEEELENRLDKIMILFRFIHGWFLFFIYLFHC